MSLVKSKLYDEDTKRIPWTKHLFIPVINGLKMYEVKSIYLKKITIKTTLKNNLKTFFNLATGTVVFINIGKVYRYV